MNDDLISKRIEELFPSDFNDILQAFNLTKLTAYLNFLSEKNEIGGFFSKKDSEKILDRHIIESIYHIYTIQKKINVSRETKVGDAGTGPGLPGYIFFCMSEYPLVSLIDSQYRKLNLLEKYHLDTYKNKHVKFIYNRAEELNLNLDLLVSRSTIPYPWSIEVFTNLLKPDGLYVPFLAGKNYDLKIEKGILENCGFKIIDEIQLNALEFLGQRHIKFLKKVKNPIKGFPRDWKIISEDIKKYNG